MPNAAYNLPADEAAVVAQAREILARYIRRNPAISSWDAAQDYARTAFAGESREVFRVLYLDRKNRLIEDHEAGRGTVDHVSVYPREVVRRAIELDASAMILAHNHPSGDPTPSEADRAMTQQMVAAAETLGLTIHDHLIVGGDRVHSMRGAGDM